MMPDDSVARPAALVTGGAVRLGRAIALGLAGRGFDVAIHYRSSAAEAERTASEIRALGVACSIHALDLADVAAIPALMDAARRAHPGLELLVNSASSYAQASILETTPETFDHEMAVNLRAPFFLTQAFARTVARGHVLNVIDNKIAFAQPHYAAYLLAKKGLAEFVRMAAVELGPAIRVNGVAPGIVMPMSSRSPEYIAWRTEALPTRRHGGPEDVAAAALFLQESRFVNGQVLVVDGGEGIAHVGRNAAQFDPAKV